MKPIEHSEIVALVEQELNKIESEDIGEFSVSDIVERVRKDHPDLDPNRLKKIVDRATKRRYGGWTNEEREAQLDARDEAIKRHAEFLEETEGEDAAYAYLESEIAKYVREAQVHEREAQLLGKGAHLLEQYGANRMIELPREAWEEYTAYGVSLGFRREDILRQWPPSLRAS